MLLNTESNDLHSMGEHERSVIQINEAEFLVQKKEMQVFFAKRKSTPIRIMACFKDHALADMLYILHIKESQLVFFLKPLGKESKMEPHSFLCPWLRDPAVNRIKG